METKIRPFEPGDLDAILALTKRAWDPVFPKLETDVDAFVMDAFYPDGWWVRQKADVTAMTTDGLTEISVSLEDEEITGFVGVRIHPEDKMGEIYIIAVDPNHQRKGIASTLMTFAFSRIKDAGMKMVMVETGGDSGHAPSRATYESIGFRRWPVARYFREL